MIPADETVHQFIRDNYPGGYGLDPVAAIHHIARLYSVAIAYLTQASFEHHVLTRRGTPLTDREWEQVRDFEDAYDHFVDDTPGPSGDTVDVEFMNHWLARAGIPGPDGEKWERP